MAHGALKTLFTLTPRIVIGSIIAYLISQNLDVWLFIKIKEKTKGRNLWFRNNGSTFVSQAVDSIIFTTISFAGIYPLLQLILFTYIIKVIVAVLDTPFIYLSKKLKPNELRQFNKMSLKTINIEGHAYFVTSRAYSNFNVFVYKKFCQIIINNLKFYCGSKHFKLLGYVIMPDHLHLILWPQGKHTVSDFMRNFKEYTAKEIIKILKNTREALAPRPELAKYLKRAGLGTSPSRDEMLKSFFNAAKNIKGQTYKLWQSRNWIENIHSQKFFEQKLNYIHNNPISAGLVKKPEEYIYSSFRNYYLKNHSIIKIDIINI